MMRFWNQKEHFSAPKISKEYGEILDKAIEQAEKRDLSVLKTVYCTFATGDTDRIRRAGACIRMALQDLSILQMIRLDEQFRWCTSLEWGIDWRKISLKSIRNEFANENDYVYALILGSFHPNGYYREQCMKDMAEFEVTLPYLLLRLNDWVMPVRKAAAGYCLNKVPKACLEEIAKSSIVFEKLQRSSRCENNDLNAIEESIRKRIYCLHPEINPDSLVKYDFHTRKAFYKILIANEDLSFELLNRILDREPHGNCKILLINTLISRKECTADCLDRYLENKAACVRRKVLEHKYEILHDTWNGLEVKLLDESRGVREYTAFIIRRHTDINIRDFYVKHLRDSHPETAIAGLGECGNKDDWTLLLPFLKRSEKSILKVVLRALGNFSEFDASELLWSYLEKEEIVIVKTAYQVILKREYYYGAKKIYEALEKNPGTASEKYYLRLLMREKSWDRLPYVISLYARGLFPEEERQLAAAIERRYMYEKVPHAAIEKVVQALEQYRLFMPKQMIERSEFDLKLIAPNINQKL